MQPQRPALAPVRNGEALGSATSPDERHPAPIADAVGMSAAIGALAGRPQDRAAPGRPFSISSTHRRHRAWREILNAAPPFPTEIVHLTRAVQDMAGKIKQQLADQRELPRRSRTRQPLARFGRCSSSA
jgi:hypothetical protein